MGEIVAGLLASHAPGITARPAIADPERRTRFLEGYRVLRQRLEQARPDLLVCFVNDHLQNFFYNSMPAYCVGLAESYQAPSQGGAEFLRLPPRRVPGAKAWARELLEAGWAAGFDFAYSQELEFWDDVSVPLHFLMPEAPVPIVPILTNCAAPPLPPPRRSYQLGRFVREFIRSGPKGNGWRCWGRGGSRTGWGRPRPGRSTRTSISGCWNGSGRERGKRWPP